ncbi:hypothetical protein ABIE56_000250 [Luteibacter sp. 621]
MKRSRYVRPALPGRLPAVRWLSIHIPGALMTVLAAVLTVGRIKQWRTLSQNTLDAGPVQLVVDPATGGTLITHSANQAVYAIAPGRLLTRIALPPPGQRDRSTVTFLQWPAASHPGRLSPVDADRAAVPVLSIDAPTRTARVIQRWLRRHPALLADEAAFAQAWAITCAGLLGECREQRLTTTPPALELVDVMSGPVIAYLVIEQDGRVFATVGSEPMLERVRDPLLTDGRHTLVTEVGDYRPAWTLSPSEASTLHALLADGLIELDPDALSS